VGFRSAKQVEGILGAATFRLLPDETKEIEEGLKQSSHT
jgi:aryl-alcohol dehydrogenase-like predicted oxidoreductase